MCGGNNGAFRYSQNKKERRSGTAFNASGGNAFSMQLFSQRQQLVEFTAKQEVEVRSAHWYGRCGKAGEKEGELIN